MAPQNAHRAKPRNPLQERIEDWKKSANQLDKDHAKGGSRLAAPSSSPLAETLS